MIDPHYYLLYDLPESTLPKWPHYLTSWCPDSFKLSIPDWHSFTKYPPPHRLLYLIDLMWQIDHHIPGTFDAFNGVKTDKYGGNMMHTSQTARKAHQGPCMCDDCGKNMQWKGIDWCITNNGYLLCSKCLLTWVRENRYYRGTREKSTPLWKLAAVA